MKNFVMFSHELLDKEHLSVIREIGRQIGVRSPSSLTKEVLIDQIIGVQCGEIEPISAREAIRGAPPKIKVDISRYYTEEESAERIRNDSRYNHRMAVIKKKREQAAAKDYEFVEVVGILEQHVSGYGFLRVNNYENSRNDCYVSLQIIRQYNLRRGDKVRGVARTNNEGAPALQQVLGINDCSPVLFSNRENFDALIPYYPTERLKLEREDAEDDAAIRCIDLFCPIGKGQRGLIVAPPKAGKTTILKKIAQSIEVNHPEVKLFVLLIDERPEEVTDMQRSINGEVVYSTFDEDPLHHIRAAELVLNRGKRLVEVGKDVVILMDSITRLSRAYNVTVSSSGKTLSGGLDPAALPGAKRIIGSARNIENGGSLTILSTALVETGSRMDDVIFEEFKGTGNMELHLSRELSEKRVFPAIDLYKSGTRKDELLLTPKELDAVFKIRRLLKERQDASESLLEMLRRTKSNADFVEKVDSWLELYRK